ncbi:unnamed protein product [Brachionus calyciflorus]|uniref:PDZ domain-containing protein n=1 Tax=Brachionus calyciflorus TaxID=104777 RepID=A0A814EEL0_9BILA|nr:unnamed protein product [Brachionus calyciflorus]
MSAFRNLSNNNYPNMAHIRPVNKPNYQSSMSSSSTSSSSSSSNSIQIRTSSPISSSGSDMSGPVNISPSKFLNAVHTSRKSQAQTCPTDLKSYSSLKQLAFDKLRRQQAIEQDLKENFQNLKLTKEPERMKSMGKIKLSIYNNFNHLTCHIVEARSVKCDLQMGTYCKISILPDLNKSFKNIRTKTIGLSVNNKNQKMSYQYDSKFSFELCELNDLNQRIVVWVCDHANQLIGCLTFKLKHVINLDKPKYVWYHLLPFKYGLSKNVKCSVKKVRSSSLTQLKPTHVNKDLIGMQKMNFIISKLNETDSYGFTVTNACPCMIGKVDLDKVSFKAGLRPGDYISRINGVNVSRASCESVVKLIKSSKNSLQIEVHREMLNSLNTRPVVLLESVPEEEEEEEEDFEEEFEFDDEEEEMRVGGNHEEEEMNYFKLIQNSLRYVDSVSSTEQPNLNDFEDDEHENVENMRRVAAKFYSNSEIRQASVRQLQPPSSKTNPSRQFI